MKKNNFFSYLVVVVYCVIIFSGCALYGNERQYKDGDWYSLATSSEVARIKQEKLALEKVMATSAQTAVIKNGKIVASSTSTGVPAGFRGKIANFSRYYRLNFILKGPEIKAYLLSAGQIQEDYLIPGEYRAFANNKYLGKFTVGARLFSFMGEELHWYVYDE